MNFKQAVTYFALILTGLTASVHAGQDTGLPFSDPDGLGPQLPVDPLISLLLTGNLPTVNDGGNKLTLTLVTSGADASHINLYQNYLIRTQLKLLNVSDIIITKCDASCTSGDCIFLGNVTNVSIVGNTFHDTPATGIECYPTTVINCHFDNNTFDKVLEAIHLNFGTGLSSHGVTINSNVITNYSRIGIETQWYVNDIQINHNYISGRLTGDNGGNMGISATAGAAPNVAATGNVDVAYNTLIGPTWANAQIFAAIENMGSGKNIHDNVICNWGNAVIWGNTTLSGQVPWHFTNNILVGVTNNPGYDEGFGNTNAPTVSGTQVFKIGQAGAPPIPTPAQTIGPSTNGSVQPATTFVATAQVNGIQISALPSTGGTLKWIATGGTDTPLVSPTALQTHSTVIPAGTTTYLDQSVPNGGWRVAYSFTGVSGIVLVNANAAQVFPPPATQPTTVPTTQPAPVTIGYSRDGGKTWTIEGTMQP